MAATSVLDRQHRSAAGVNERRRPAGRSQSGCKTSGVDNNLAIGFNNHIVP
jgi:hypothetical protein